MSYVTLGIAGLAAVHASQWDEAVTKLSTALDSSANPTWLLGRSKAFIALGRFREALDDAEVAWHAAYARSTRPSLIHAQYRRAVAHYRLGEYANADCCCLYAMRLVRDSPAVESPDPKAERIAEDGSWTATVDEAMEDARNDPMVDTEYNALLGTPPPVGCVSHPMRDNLTWRLASALRIQTLRAMQGLPAGHAARKVTVSLKPDEVGLPDNEKLVKCDVPPEPPSESAPEPLSESAPEPLSEPQPEPPSEPQPKPPSDSAPEPLSEPQPEPPSEPQPEPSSESPPPAPKLPASDRVPFQEYQTLTYMNVSIFSKGVDKDKLRVKFGRSTVYLFPVHGPKGDARPFNLALWTYIDPVASTYTVTPNKVELRLQKELPGKWPKLENDTAGFFGWGNGAPFASGTVKTAAKASGDKTDTSAAKASGDKTDTSAAKTTDAAAGKGSGDSKQAQAAPAPSSDDKEPSSPGKASSPPGKAPAPPAKASAPPAKASAPPAKASAPPAKASAGPSYPSSSRSGPKDWELIGKDELDEDEDEGDVNAFFKKLFKNATPEQQRAMMKSFTESNGTSLSTDWNDVKGRTVETVPPEGVEAKKWN